MSDVQDVQLPKADEKRVNRFSSQTTYFNIKLMSRLLYNNLIKRRINRMVTMKTQKKRAKLLSLTVTISFSMLHSFKMMLYYPLQQSVSLSVNRILREMLGAYGLLDGFSSGDRYKTKRYQIKTVISHTNIQKCARQNLNKNMKYLQTS